MTPDPSGPSNASAASPNAITINPSASGRPVAARAGAIPGADAGEIQRGGRASVDIDHTPPRTRLLLGRQKAKGRKAQEAVVGWTRPSVTGRLSLTRHRRT